MLTRQPAHCRDLVSVACTKVRLDGWLKWLDEWLGGVVGCLGMALELRMVVLATCSAATSPHVVAKRQE